MSTSLAIAAVTTALRNMLESGLNDDPSLSGTTVTVRPLDKARENVTGNSLNLFLHQTSPNAAWRNMDLPRQVHPGETSRPPLALTLNYLLTAFYGDNEDTVDTATMANRLLGSHRLLGQAMAIFHDNAILDEAAVQAALPAADALENPFKQGENVRITVQPLSLDELSKLWTGFQTQYRLSVAYEVSVVLIETRQPAVTPLPVLTIGVDNSGVAVYPSTLPPYPTLEAATAPDNQPSVRLGELVTLNGHHLDGVTSLRFRTAALSDPIEVPPEPGATTSQVVAQIPNNPADWPAGFYTVAGVENPGTLSERESNAVPFSLAPRILAMSTAPAAGGDLTITVQCSPEARPTQRISFLLGSRELPVTPFGAQTNSLDFHLSDPVPGDYFVRLRVDGVDSLMVDRAVTPPVFDTTQRLTIA